MCTTGRREKRDLIFSAFLVFFCIPFPILHSLFGVVAAVGWVGGFGDSLTLGWETDGERSQSFSILLSYHYLQFGWLVAPPDRVLFPVSTHKTTTATTSFQMFILCSVSVAPKVFRAWGYRSLGELPPNFHIVSETQSG